MRPILYKLIIAKGPKPERMWLSKLEGNEVTENTLEVSTPSDLLMLFGTRDQHLRRLRDFFNVTITHRDGRIRISGEHEPVKGATRALKAMREVGLREGTVTSQDVEQAIATQVDAGLGDSRGYASPPEMRERPPLRTVSSESSESKPRRTSSPPTPTGPSIDLHQAGRRIQARTPGQSTYLDAIREHDLTFCSGPAGSGKTYLAVACAVEALMEQRIRKIVLVRPAVEAGENLGFLPGDLRAKLNPYLRPLLDAINEMVDYDQARELMERDIVEVIPLAYMRGRTLSDAFIILDEAQNTTVAQMKMFLTRMGERSRMVISGDTSQVDLPKGVQSGLRDAIMRLGNIPEIGMVRLQKTDIVRHALVQRIVRAYEEQDR